MRLRPPRPTKLSPVQRDALAVGVTTGLYAISFGAIAAAAHASVGQAMVLSAVLFSGGSQFALVGVLADGGSGASAVAVAMFLGLRNMLYAVRLRKVHPAQALERTVAAHLTLDESTAMATAHDGLADSRTAFWWTGLSVFVFWNLFTLLGAVSGSFLKDPSRLGLTAAAPAAYLALLWPRLAQRTHLRVGLLAVAITLALLPFAPRGVPVLASLLAIPLGMPRRSAPSAEVRPA
jgi:predicted branched-subunit amino acid permease